MKTPRKASPARSQGPVRTPIRHKPRRTLSVSSARSSASVIISALAQQRQNYASFVVSPLGSRRMSILSDNTEIEEPRRKSWWKNLAENSTTSQDIVDLLEKNENLEPHNIIEELDMEILSQENKKNYTLELPESSDSESINSIVIPQRKLFPQKENQKINHFAQILLPRETLAKQHETVVDKTLVTGTRELFQNKKRTRPIFPAALLNISLNRTAADEAKQLAAPEVNAQVRNIFGHRNTKRKNKFSNFILTESDHEISEIQPKVFGFQKTKETSRHSSLRGIREPSPASSVTTDMEMDDWKMLPSSTMVDNQLEVLMTGQTPKRARLSNLTEMESEAGSAGKKQSNKSNSSKQDKSRKSKTFTKEKTHSLHYEPIVESDNETTGKIDKSRKSKTFTKEKACEHETDYEMINKSTTLIILNENQNKSIKDTTKSRKSKTFIKGTVDLETSRTSRNKSKVQQDDNVLNKSKTKISDHNTSMKTRSQSMNASPNNSQVIEDVDVKSQTTNKKKTVSSSKNLQDENPIEQEKDDDELNFSLYYESDNEEQVIAGTQNKSMLSKSMAQKQIITANSSNSHKSVTNNLIEESPEVESSQGKNIRKEHNIETNHDQGDKYLHLSRSDPVAADKVEVKQNSMNKSKVISQENENEQINHKEVALDEVDNVSDNEQVNQVEDEIDNEEENGVQNGSQVDNKIDNEEENGEQNESQVENEIDNEPDNEEENEEHNESQVEYEIDNEEDNGQNNESRVESEIDNEEQIDSQVEEEIDNESDNEEENGEQNESQVGDEIENVSDNEGNDLSLEQNQTAPEIESQEVEDDYEENQNETHKDSDTEQNESQIQNESNIQEENCEEEQNESQQVEDNNDNEQEEQDSDAEQNESDMQDEEQNESEHEYEQESEAMAETTDENEENPDNSQAKGDESEQEKNTEDEIIETPNVSHDTTGRNRKKNKSPEAILHHSRNLNDSFYLVKGEKTVRKTDMLKSIHRDLVPARESTGFSDGSNSSAQGSGWDSHRTTRKTLRQTFGKDFTPRKSLRALVMEKTAKRQTQHNDMASVTAPLFPQANSTEMPSTRFDDEDEVENITPNEISIRTRQTTIEKYLMGVAKMNAERRRKIEEKVRDSLKEPPRLNIFKIPATPLFACKAAPKAKKESKSAMRAAKATKLFGDLPPEVLEDMKYKPPKRFQPRDAPWATKHLYKFLEAKLEPKYNYKARIRAERLVENLYNFTKDLRRRTVAGPDAVAVLKREMARLHIVKTHHEFYEFFGQFMPRDVRRKVMPDLINNIDLPRQGVFSDIL